MEGGLLPTPNPSAQGGGEQAGHGKTLALPEGDAPRGHRGANPATPGQPTPSPLVGEGRNGRAPTSTPAAQIARARDLRRDATPRERALWQELRQLNRQLGTHFRRQAPIGPYIADFAEFGRRLMIELDGGHHALAPQAGHDRRRDDWLGAQGFRVLRFWNSDDIPAVMETVFRSIAPNGETQ